MEYLLPVPQKNRIFLKNPVFFECPKTFGCAESIASNQWRIGIRQTFSANFAQWVKSIYDFLQAMI